MEEVSEFLYQEVTLDDLCPECGNILIRGMWDAKLQTLVDICSECNKVVFHTVETKQSEEDG